MKTQLQKISVLTTLIVTLVISVASSQTLVVPPSPGDLSTVEHLTQSDDYIVEVKKSGDANYTTCFVYKTDNYASNAAGGEKRKETAVSFTNFSFSGTSVDVKITTNFTASSVTIRPLNYNIVPTRNGNVITFTLASPKKISVEVNNRLNPLFLFADAPDVPNLGATYYYGPGVHNVGLKKLINSNQSVYIAGGAVVEGTFKLPNNATNIDFRGRGVISNGALPTLVEHTASLDSCYKYATFSGPSIWVSTNSHVNYEGFIIANGAGWTFSFYDAVHTIHDNSWRNIKQVQWTGCTDGIWFDGDNHVIDDCFIFNNDDLLTTHGSNNCTISNTTLWGGQWGGRMLMHAQYGSSSDITYDNINVLGIHSVAAVLIKNEGSVNNTLNNFKFKNIRIESHPYDGTYWTNKFLRFEHTKADINNWEFENITLDDKNTDEGDIYGTSTGPINGITFRNLKMGGSYVTSLAGANMDKNAYASNITFELTPEINVKAGTTNIADGTGSYWYGSLPTGSTFTQTFTIENKGGGTLNLTGTPRVTVTGAGFSRIVDAATSVSAGGTTTFQIRFTPTTVGNFNGTISIANNDADENPYNFAISGLGTAPVNLITNSTFDTNTTGWSPYFKIPAAGSIASVAKTGYSGKACKVTITNGGASTWDAQLRQTIGITADKTYTVTFKASVESGTRSIGFTFMQNVSPYNTWWPSTSISLTTTPTAMGPYTFNCATTDATNLFVFLLGGGTTAVYIDDVVITESTSRSAVKAIKGIIDESPIVVNEMVVYPNPAKNTLNVNIPTQINESITISIVDLQGRTISSNNYTTKIEGVNAFELNVGSITQGTYILKVSTPTANKTKMIMLK